MLGYLWAQNSRKWGLASECLGEERRERSLAYAQFIWVHREGRGGIGAWDKEGEPAPVGLSWGARITQERPPTSLPGTLEI